jgi:hypothetical protein
MMLRSAVLLISNFLVSLCIDYAISHQLPTEPVFLEILIPSRPNIFKNISLAFGFLAVPFA